MDRSTETSKINELASTHLGSAGSYAVTTDKYDKSLLVPMPRSEARDDWKIKGDEFVGFDTWNCHEATFLLDNGSPVAGTVKFVYPASSEFMVESKSMKLYLNTFDMCKMGDTKETAIANYETTIRSHLTEILGVNVDVRFHDINSIPFGVDARSFIPIENLIDIDGVDIDDYKAEKSHFKTTKGSEEKISVFTNVLRSRCRHTKQKDTGAAYITIQTKRGREVDLESLFKQIVSLREVDEFHEFCSEKLYTEIMKDSGVDGCCVTLLYARRGSLDINPSRATRKELLPEMLGQAAYRSEKVMCQ